MEGKGREEMLGFIEATALSLTILSKSCVLSSHCGHVQNPPRTIIVSHNLIQNLFQHLYRTRHLFVSYDQRRSHPQFILHHNHQKPFLDTQCCEFARDHEICGIMLINVEAHVCIAKHCFDVEFHESAVS